MMLKKSRCLVLAMLLILVVVSCATFAAVKPIKLIYGHQGLTSEFWYTEGDLYFKKLVEENSKGQISVEIYVGSQLGTIPEQIQAVKSGAEHLNYTTVGEFVPYWKELASFDLPYLYRDQKHYLKVAERFTSMIHQNEMAAKTGLRILGVRTRSPRQLTTKFPVNKLEDIKGLKIRIPESPISVGLWKALGAIPTVIPVADLYTALATGTVDAQENPFDSCYYNKMYEVQKYCALTTHKLEVMPMVISEKIWKRLTTGQRKIIQNALDISNKHLVKVVLDNEEEFKNLLAKEGMKFTQPDVAPFREKAKTIWNQFGDKKVIKKIQGVK
jgi:tripartite ATP-independent transporter DctP family solute receptor